MAKKPKNKPNAITLEPTQVTVVEPKVEPTALGGVDNPSAPECSGEVDDLTWDSLHLRVSALGSLSMSNDMHVHKNRGKLSPRETKDLLEARNGISL